MFALIFSINRLHLFLWIQIFFSALSCQPSRVDIRWCLLNAARVYVANTVQKQSWLWFSFVFFSFFLTIHSNPKKFWVSSLQFSGLPLHHVSWYFSFPLFFLFCHWSCKTQWIFHKRTLPSLKEKKKRDSSASSFHRFRREVIEPLASNQRGFVVGPVTPTGGDSSAVWMRCGYFVFVGGVIVGGYGGVIGIRHLRGFWFSRELRGDQGEAGALAGGRPSVDRLGTVRRQHPSVLPNAAGDGQTGLVPHSFCKC